MKNLLRIVIVVAMICGTKAFAQQPPAIKIGQQCPDFAFKIANGKISNGKISDYKGKLLILDFWATWCSPCRWLLEKADSITSQFNGQVVILPISDEKRETVLAYLNSLEKVKGLKIATAYEDKIMNSSFPHTYIPHEVWIDADGKVIAITGSDEVNGTNISAMLNRKQVDLKEKKDETFAQFDYGKPILLGGQGLIIPKSSILLEVDNEHYHGILTKYIPTLDMGSMGQRADWISCRNVGLLWICKVVTSGYQPSFMSDNRISLQVKDTLQLTGAFLKSKDQVSNWDKPENQHFYCFEIVLKDTTLRKQKFKIAQELLNRFLKSQNLQSDLEFVPNECYVLSKTGNTDALKSGPEARGMEASQYQLRMQHCGLIEFITKLQVYFLQNSPYPIVDDTGIIDPVNMELTCDLTNIDAINKELVKYGLQFEKKNMNIQKLVVKNITPAP